MTFRSSALISGALVGLVAGIILGMGTFAYPPPNSDYGFFVVPATNWARYGELTAPSFPVVYQFDPEGRLVFNGFIFSMLVGQSMRLIDWKDGAAALFGTDAVAAMAICLWGLIFFERAKNNDWNKGLFLLLLASSSLALAAIYLHNYGRPESVSASLLLILAWLHFRTLPEPPKFYVTGLISALCGCTSPVAGIMALQFSACWALFHFGLNARTFKWGIGVVISFVLSLFLIVAIFFPYPSELWFQGISKMFFGASTAGTKDGIDWNLVSNLIVWKEDWLGLGIFAAFAIAVLPLSLWFGRRRFSVWLLYLPFVLLCLLSLVRATIGSPWTYYRLFSVFPAVMLLLISFSLSKTNGTIFLRRVIALVTLGLTAAIGSGAIRSAGDFVDYLASGVKLETARADFAKLMQEDDGHIGISNTLIPLSEEFDRIRLIAPITDVQYPSDHQINIDIMVVQADTCSAAEVLLPKIGFIKSGNSTSNRLWLGTGYFGGIIPTYGFCVYKRQKKTTN